MNKLQLAAVALLSVFLGACATTNTGKVDVATSVENTLPYVKPAVVLACTVVLANEMEGHPDNVATAIYGGANIAWQDMQRGAMVAQSVHIEVDARIGALAFIPATSVATSKARKMLPESIAHSDAVRNSSNAATPALRSLVSSAKDCGMASLRYD